MRNFPAPFTTKNIYNETFTYPYVISGGSVPGFNFNAEAATVKQALSCNPKPGLNNLERVHQRTSCTKVTYLQSRYRQSIKTGRTERHVRKGGYMDGPGGGITPVNINGQSGSRATVAKPIPAAGTLSYTL